MKLNDMFTNPLAIRAQHNCPWQGSRIAVQGEFVAYFNVPAEYLTAFARRAEDFHRDYLGDFKV